MATINPVIVPHEGYLHVLWENIAEGDDTSSVLLRPSNNDKTVQVTGTFGGATITIQGSIDGVNWFSVKNATGTTVSFTSAGGAFMAENVPYYRVVIENGTNSDVDVHICAAGV